MNELWKPIVGYENKYLISNRGRVWSVKYKKIRKPYLRPTGHQAIALTSNYEKYHTHISTLVGRHFLDYCEGDVVLHRDETLPLPDRDFVENLRCDSQRENILDMYTKRRNPRQVDESYVENVERMRSNGASWKEVADYYGKSLSTVRMNVKNYYKRVNK